MENIWISDELRTIANEVIMEYPDELGWINSENINIAYVYSDVGKLKDGREVFGECIRASTLMKSLAGYQFIIKFYEPNTARFTDEQLHILMYHELLHAAIKNEKTAIVPHDYVVNDFKAVIDKYGKDWAAVK